MISLEELARRELKLLDHVRSAGGEIREKAAQLRSAGVFAESAEVHAAYVDLAAEPIESLEALERAVFLGWYESAEPSAFAGIGEHSAVDSGRIDSEFNVMLGWYWHIASYHFEAHSPRRLADYISSLEPFAYKRYDFGALEGCGQMGLYWKSVRHHAT